MKILIHNDIKIAEIKRLFSKEYPFLKLEFFEPIHRSVPPRKRNKVANEASVGKIRTVTFEGELNVDGQTTVAALEDQLSEIFGLSVQVYRRSGNIWIETNITDGWTLDHQNEQGRELAIHNVETFEDIMRQRREEGSLNRDVAE